MPDKLIKIIQALEKGDVRRIDGSILDESNQRYQYKAYVISSSKIAVNSLDLIRIDIRRIK